jgi:hypothetical protein
MEFEIRETAETLDLHVPMPPGRRILFLLMALFPCLAPYELILRIRWEDYLNPFFLFAAVISAGAMAVSAFFVWAAVAGLDSQMTFFRSRGLFTHSAGAPILPKRTREYPVDMIAALEVETHEWSDGAPSYSFEVMLRDGRKLHLGSSWSRTEAEGIRDRVAAFLKLPS